MRSRRPWRLLGRCSSPASSSRATRDRGGETSLLLRGGIGDPFEGFEATYWVFFSSHHERRTKEGYSLPLRECLRVSRTRLLGKYSLRPPRTEDLRGETSLFFRGGVRGELSPKSMLVVFLTTLTSDETFWKDLSLIRSRWPIIIDKYKTFEAVPRYGIPPRLLSYPKTEVACKVDYR